MRSFTLVALLLVISALGGCRASTTLDFVIDERVAFAVTPTVAVAVRGDVGIQLDGTIVARLPREAGRTAPLPIEGRSCTVRVVEPTVEVEISEPVGASRTDRSRDFLAGRFQIACGDGPAPRSPATLEGAHALPSLLWTLPAIVLGALAGLGARRYDRTMSTGAAFAAIGLTGLAIGGALLPILRFQGWYIATYVLLATALGGVAYLHARASSRGVSPWGVLVPPAIVVGWALLFPRWSPAAPVGALSLALPAWTAALLHLDQKKKKKR